MSGAVPPTGDSPACGASKGTSQHYGDQAEVIVNAESEVLMRDREEVPRGEKDVKYPNLNPVDLMVSAR